MFRKALAVQQSQAFSCRVEVCRVQHPLWLVHTDRCREQGYVRIGVCVCVCKREPSLIFTQAVLGLAISRHGEGRGKTPRQQGREHRARGKQASLLSSWLSRRSLYCSVGVHTLVWGRVHFLTGQQDSQKEKIRINMVSFPQVPFSASHSPIY